MWNVQVWWVKRWWNSVWLSNFLPFCDFRSRTAFERAKTDVFRIRTHNIGPLKKIRYVSIPDPDCFPSFTLASIFQNITDQVWTAWPNTVGSDLGRFVVCNETYLSPFYSPVASGLSMTTPVWTPAGSWTEWWWRMWSGLTWGSTLLVTTGSVRWRQTAFISENCWVAWTPWKCPNVCILRYEPIRTCITLYNQGAM